MFFSLDKNGLNLEYESKINRYIFNTNKNIWNTSVSVLLLVLSRIINGPKIFTYVKICYEFCKLNGGILRLFSFQVFFLNGLMLTIK